MTQNDATHSASYEPSASEVVTTGLTRVGFVHLEAGDFADLYLQSHQSIESSAEPSTRDDDHSVEDSGDSPKSVLHRGGMPDLLELLEHHRVATVVLEVTGTSLEQTQPADSGTTAHPFVQSLTQALAAGLIELAERYEARGLALDSLGSPHRVANDILAQIPGPSRWDDLLGPFLSADAVARRLSVPKKTVIDLSEKWELLGLMTSDEMLVFPSFQFVEGGELIPGLTEVLRPFGQNKSDRWAVAGWLVSEFASLNGGTVIDALADLEDLSPVLDLASSTAERWSRGAS